MQNFSNKVALITGGGSGIGLGVARALAAEGARLVITGTNQAKLDGAVADLRKGGAEAIDMILDVTKPQAWAAAADQIETRMGPVEMLVLNAGAQSRRVAVEENTLEEWRWVFDVNVNGVFLGLREFLPRMKRGGAESHVLITASIGALTPRPLAGAYGASKAAALALAESTRMELKESKIGISVLCPAGVRTSFDETSRRHSPEAVTEENYAYMRPIIEGGMDPLKVGVFTLKAIREGRFYIFSHPGFKPIVGKHCDERLAAFTDSAEPESKSFGAQPISV